MKPTNTSLFLLATIALLTASCGSKDNKTPETTTINERNVTTGNTPVSTTATTSGDVAPSERVVLDNKGIGPIKDLKLTALDQNLANKGQEIYKNMCTACHKPTKKFIGPAPKGILDRRSPEWVMNMILNPEKMLAEDPLAMELLKEFNGAPMANQNLTEEEARAVLEYFRTL